MKSAFTCANFIATNSNLKTYLFQKVALNYKLGQCKRREIILVFNFNCADEERRENGKMIEREREENKQFIHTNLLIIYHWQSKARKKKN